MPTISRRRRRKGRMMAANEPIILNLFFLSNIISLFNLRATLFLFVLLGHSSLRSGMNLWWDFIVGV
jgi:hypothetical protein